MSLKSDLHIHSTYSDGTIGPSKLVKIYKEKGYDMISLTDHDGIDGVKEAVAAGKALNIKVVSGIELSVAYVFMGKELELHILGYDIDIENRELTDKLKEIREKRRDRNERLLAHLNELGYEISYEDLLERPGQTYIGKPNFARAMRRKGYNPENMWEIFSQINKDKISAKEGIDLIRGAGGTAVLAHPFRIRGLPEADSEGFWNSLDTIIGDLKEKGLSGLECRHPSASDSQSLKLSALAEKYGLRITGGSDFHG